MDHHKSNLQFDNGLKTETTDIVIGLDFGTSSSKVVLRSPFVAGARALGVPFLLHGHPQNKFLFPVRPRFGSTGILEISDELSVPQFPALKMRLINDLTGNALIADHERAHYTNEQLSVGYLAEVLRESRRWFLETQKEVYGNFEVRWLFNLGIPSTGLKGAEIRQAFQQIAEAAWRVSTSTEPITLGLCQTALSIRGPGSPGFEGIQREDINIWPEVSAEVIGYAKSTVRQNGLHLMVDIGAGTVDVCCFSLDGEPGDNKYLMLGSSVDRLGAFELHTRRINEMRARLDRWLHEYGLREDPIEPIPSTERGYLPVDEEGSLVAPFGADQDFQRLCSQRIHKVLHYVRRQRDPMSPSWGRGITTFLCGGGRDVDLYKRTAEQQHDWWSTNGGVAGLRFIEIPRPPNLLAEGLTDHDYHRLAVAYGLSHSRDEIGEIKPEYEIDDLVIPPMVREIEDRYPSKEWT